MLKLAREGLLHGLRTALQQARKTRKPVRKTGLRVRSNGAWTDVDLEVLPLAGLSSLHFLVLFDRPGPKAHPAPAASTRRGKAAPRGGRNTERLEQELAATREYLQSIIEEVEAANEEILSSNEELQSTNEELDTAREELQGMLSHVLGCPDQGPGIVEVRLRTAAGVKPVQLVTRRDPVAARTGVSYHTAIVDLTDVRRLEEARQQAEHARQKSLEGERAARAANQAKDRFLAMLSHELRTPLTPILAAADWMASQSTVTPDLAGKIDTVRRNVRAEAHLIDDLLDVARITQKDLTIHRLPVDLHRVIADTLDGWTTVLSQRRITLDVQLQAGAC